MHSDLDAGLLRLTPQDVFDAKAANSHILVLGASGSGKTSGPGRAIARAYLAHGMGGLVACYKAEEASDWVAHARATGRSGSLILWDTTNHRFNFIDYLLARHGADGINSVTECLMAILDMVRLASPAPGKVGEQFWSDTSRQILRHSLPLLHAVTGTVRIEDILRFVRTAPSQPEQLRDPEWQRTAYFYQVFAGAARRLDDAVGERCVGYWRDDFARLDPKTRGSITLSLSTALDRFNHGWLRRTFCTDSTIAPELCSLGAVIVMAMPPVTLGEDGAIAQMLFTHVWQQAMLGRRALGEAHWRRLVFYYADEAQRFVQPGDADFLSTCRGTRVCCVYLTQSLPTLYAKLGDQERAHFLAAQFSTKLFCANSCATTNEWAAKTIGRGMHWRESYNEGQGTNRSYGTGMGLGTNSGTNSSSGGSYSSGNNSSQSGSSWSAGSSSGSNDSRNRNRGGGDSENRSWGRSEQMDYLIEPGLFGSALRTGGKANRGRVSTVWYSSGHVFQASGRNFLLLEFAQ